MADSPRRRQKKEHTVAQMAKVQTSLRVKAARIAALVAFAKKTGKNKVQMEGVASLKRGLKSVTTYINKLEKALGAIEDEEEEF